MFLRSSSTQSSYSVVLHAFSSRLPRIVALDLLRFNPETALPDTVFIPLLNHIPFPTHCQAALGLLCLHPVTALHYTRFSPFSYMHHCSHLQSFPHPPFHGPPQSRYSVVRPTFWTLHLNPVTATCDKHFKARKGKKKNHVQLYIKVEGNTIMIVAVCNNVVLKYFTRKRYANCNL